MDRKINFENIDFVKSRSAGGLYLPSDVARAYFKKKHPIVAGIKKGLEMLVLVPAAGLIMSSGGDLVAQKLPKGFLPKGMPTSPIIKNLPSFPKKQKPQLPGTTFDPSSPQPEACYGEDCQINDGKLDNTGYLGKGAELGKDGVFMGEPQCIPEKGNNDCKANKIKAFKFKGINIKKTTGKSPKKYKWKGLKSKSKKSKSPKWKKPSKKLTPTQLKQLKKLCVCPPSSSKKCDPVKNCEPSVAKKQGDWNYSAGGLILFPYVSGDVNGFEVPSAAYGGILRVTNGGMLYWGGEAFGAFNKSQKLNSIGVEGGVGPLAGKLHTENTQQNSLNLFYLGAGGVGGFYFLGGSQADSVFDLGIETRLGLYYSRIQTISKHHAQTFKNGYSMEGAIQGNVTTKTDNDFGAYMGFGLPFKFGKVCGGLGFCVLIDPIDLDSIFIDFSAGYCPGGKSGGNIR